GHRGEVQSVIRLARHVPRRVARQDIYLALLQLREPFAGVKWNELDLARVIKNGSREGTAKIDIQAGPISLVVRAREAGQAGIDAAEPRIPVLRSFQGFGIV